MKTSTELVRRIDRELTWGAVLWFLWGGSFAIGKWLNIETWKADKAGAVLWFGFGGLVVLGRLVLDCANAVLAAIRENGNLTPK